MKKMTSSRFKTINWCIVSALNNISEVIKTRISATSLKHWAAQADSFSHFVEFICIVTWSHIPGYKMWTWPIMWVQFSFIASPENCAEFSAMCFSIWLFCRREKVCKKEDLSPTQLPLCQHTLFTAANCAKISSFWCLCWTSRQKSLEQFQELISKTVQQVCSIFTLNSLFSPKLCF